MYKRQVNGLFLGNLNLCGKDKRTSSRRCQPQQAPAAHGTWYQLTGLAITSATVKLPIFIIFSPKAIYLFRNSKVTETHITRARTTRKEVFERSRAGYPYGVFGRQLLQTSHLLLTSRLPEQTTAAAGTCPVLWVRGTPMLRGNIHPSQSQARWFSAHICNLILKKKEFGTSLRKHRDIPE